MSTTHTTARAEKRTPKPSPKKARETALAAALTLGMVSIGEFAFQGRDSRRVQVVTALGKIDGAPARILCDSKGRGFWRVEVRDERIGWLSVLEPVRAEVAK